MRGWLQTLALSTTALCAQPEPDAGGDAARGAAQHPAVQGLIRELRRSHRGATAERTVDRFEARLKVTPRREDEDHVEVKLFVKFLSPDLIRYEVDEAGRRIERGRDRKGPWSRVDDQIVDLRSRDFRMDLRELQREIRLARLLLRFLDPAHLVEQLADRGDVARETLRYGSLEPIACRTLEGDLEEFPFYATAGEARRARVKLWVDAETGRLTAVRALALDADGRPLPRGEFVFLSAHKAVDGVLLPTLLAIDRLEGDARRPEVKVRLSAFDVFPELTAEDLER